MLLGNYHDIIFLFFFKSNNEVFEVLICVYFGKSTC